MSISVSANNRINVIVASQTPNSPDLSRIKELLQSKKSSDKRDALEQLSDISRKNPDLIPDELIRILIGSLNEDWPYLTSIHDLDIHYILRYIGPRAVKYLIPDLKKKDDKAVRGAADSLWFIASKKPELIPSDIVQLMADNLNHQNYEYYRGARNLGNRIIYDRAVLSSKDNNAAATAINILIPEARINPYNISEELIPLIAKNITNNSNGFESYIYGHASEILLMLGQRAIPYLKKAESSKDPELSKRAKVILDNIAPEASLKQISDTEITQLILACYSDTDISRPVRNTDTITELLKVGRSAAPQFAAALSSSNLRLKHGAINALFLMANRNPDVISDETIPFLIKSIDFNKEYRDFDIYFNICQTLILLGQRAVPYFKDALMSGNKEIISGIIYTLGKTVKESPEIITDDVISSLIRLYPEPNTNADISQILIAVSKRLNPFLKELLSSTDKKTRDKAKDLIDLIAKNNPDAISDEIIKLLINKFKEDLDLFDHGHFYWPKHTSEILAMFGKRSIPFLTDALCKDDRYVNIGASYALCIIAKKDPSLIDDNIIKLLILNIIPTIDYNMHYADVHSYGHSYAVDALCFVGQRAIPHLQRALTSKERLLQAGAALTICGISEKNFNLISYELFSTMIIENSSDWHFVSEDDLIANGFDKKFIPYLIKFIHANNYPKAIIFAKDLLKILRKHS